MFLKSMVSLNNISHCICYAGEISSEVEIEADSNDISARPRPHACPVCDKRFKQKGELNYHKLVHTGEKLYSCAHCEKRFTNRKYLGSHMNIHSSKYKCTESRKVL